MTDSKETVYNSISQDKNAIIPLNDKSEISFHIQSKQKDRDRQIYQKCLIKGIQIIIVNNKLA